MIGRLLTFEEVAGILGQHIITVRRKALAGSIPGLTNIGPAGGRPVWRIDRLAFEGFLRDRAVCRQKKCSGNIA